MDFWDEDPHKPENGSTQKSPPLQSGGGEETTPLREGEARGYDSVPTHKHTETEDFSLFFRMKLLEELDKVRRRLSAARFGMALRRLIMLLCPLQVEKFYHHMMEDHENQFTVMVDQLRMTMQQMPNRRPSFIIMENATGPLAAEELRRAQLLPTKAKDSVERSLMDLNRELALLKNYCILNYTGFVKILKKYDKVQSKAWSRYTSARME